MCETTPPLSIFVWSTRPAKMIAQIAYSKAIIKFRLVLVPEKKKSFNVIN